MTDPTVLNAAPTLSGAASEAKAAVKADVSSFASKATAAAIKYGIPAAALALGVLLGRVL